MSQNSQGLSQKDCDYIIIGWKVTVAHINTPQHLVPLFHKVIKNPFLSSSSSALRVSIIDVFLCIKITWDTYSLPSKGGFPEACLGSECAQPQQASWHCVLNRSFRNLGFCSLQNKRGKHPYCTTWEGNVILSSIPLPSACSRLLSNTIITGLWCFKSSIPYQGGSLCCTYRCLQQSWGTAHLWRGAPAAPGSTVWGCLQWH